MFSFIAAIYREIATRCSASSRTNPFLSNCGRTTAVSRLRARQGERQWHDQSPLRNASVGRAAAGAARRYWPLETGSKPTPLVSQREVPAAGEMKPCLWIVG